MNKERVEAFIEVLQHADKLDMTVFQTAAEPRDGSPYARTLDELHACGNTACIAGYLAVSPEFLQAGGEPYAGEPKFSNRFADGALAQYFEIPEMLAAGIVYSRPVPYDGTWKATGFWEQYYSTPFKLVNKSVAIQMFRDLLAGRFDDIRDDEAPDA